MIALGLLEASLTISATFFCAMLPRIPFPIFRGSALISSTSAPIPVIAIKVLKSGSGTYTALVIAFKISNAWFAMRSITCCNSSVAEISRATSASAVISLARRCASWNNRAFSSASESWSATCFTNICSSVPQVRCSNSSTTFKVAQFLSSVRNAVESIVDGTRRVLS